MKRSMLALVVCALAAPAAAAPPESTTDAPIHFFADGSFKGWQLIDGASPEGVWEVVDGELHLKSPEAANGNLFTTDEYGDFDLSFEWKVPPGTNTGVKYRVRQYGNRLLGCEYQILDDPNYPKRMRDVQSCGSLYDLFAADPSKDLRPAGEYNQGRIVVRGNHIEHWLNGKQVVSADVGSDEWNRRVAGSKFSDAGAFGENRRGRLMITDHNGEAWFRNVKLQPLDDATD